MLDTLQATPHARGADQGMRKPVRLPASATDDSDILTIAARPSLPGRYLQRVELYGARPVWGVRARECERPGEALLPGWEDAAAEAAFATPFASVRCGARNRI